MWDIQLFKLNFDNQEREAVTNVIDSGWLTMGERTLEFESAFSRFHGDNISCLAVANCTAALHMALLALDIKKDDEVIIPALTFVADINVVKMVGAKAVLADSSSLDDWNVSVSSIEKCITSKTKAVIVVHYAGYSCDMPGIVKLCKERKIKLIEDVAHAPGASILAKKCGTWGDIGCFSFFSNKNLSIGEGGMVMTKDLHLYKRLQYLRSHGMTSLTLDRHKGRAITYDVSEPGLNYRMDEMRSSIGIVQLGKLEEGNKRRKEHTDLYRSELKGSPFFMPYKERLESEVASYHIMPIMLPEELNREDVIGHLKSKKIQSSIHYPPFWNFTGFKDEFKKENTPITSIISERQLTLPLFPTMTSENVKSVAFHLLELV